MNDPFNLERFVSAQTDIYADALAELESGRKTSHWMWFIFPQLAALGRSETSLLYGISSLEEAQAYLAHPLLGPRLLTCARTVNALSGRTAHDIFASPDYLKFRSCMTLFSEAEPSQSVFTDALAKYYGGDADPETLSLLRAPSAARG